MNIQTPNVLAEQALLRPKLRKSKAQHQKKVVLHDYFSIFGGGERLVLTLVKSLRSDLVFGYRRNSSFPLSDIEGNAIDLGVQLQLPILRTLNLAYSFYQYGSQLGPYGAYIYSGVCAPFAALTSPPGGRKIFYCHTPARFLFDKKEAFLRRLPEPIRYLMQFIYPRFEEWYRNAVDQMDVIVANSCNVQDRIRRYLGKESVVIYPPCDTGLFRWISDDGYYLSMARHDSLKRVDRIIAAFLRIPYKQLVVTSCGPETKRLRATAANAKNIRFTGGVSDQMLRELVGRATATIYIPEDEDFGMSPLESMAAGKPVIGVNEGGIMESVIDGETGILLAADPSIDDIINSVAILNSNLAAKMRTRCEERAQLFSTQVFVEEMKKLF